MIIHDHRHDTAPQSHMHKIAQTNPNIPIPSSRYVIVGILCLTLPSPSCLDVTRNASLFESYWLQLDTAVVSSRLFDL